MSTLWQTWQYELESLPALAEEWTEEADEFVQNLQDLLAQKRAVRGSALRLVDEIKHVHVCYQELLAFFDIEAAYLRWSVMNCPSEKVEQARSALAEWCEVLQKYSDAFPPPEERSLSYAGMRILMFEAQSAAAMILPGFQSLNSYFAPASAAPEKLQAAPADKGRSARAA